MAGKKTDKNHKPVAPTLGTTKSGSLRQRLLIFVGGLIVLSLLGSTLSLYRITEVNRLMDTINRVAIPLGKVLTQLQADAEVYRREMERSVGYSHWKDAHWKPRAAPKWIHEILRSEIARTQAFLAEDGGWGENLPQGSIERWKEWSRTVTESFEQLELEGAQLLRTLEQGGEGAAGDLYVTWNSHLVEWLRQVQWGGAEYERTLRQTFALAEKQVADLRTGLEIILVVVVILSLLLLWLGERAIRPLREITDLARDIAARGLRKEDKALFPEMPLSRSDEVSGLTREFHRMATALLEREKTVESQKHQLQEQNHLLRRIGELNQNILKSVSSVLVVTDLNGRITHCNPSAEHLLGTEAVGKDLFQMLKLAPLFAKFGQNFQTAQGPITSVLLSKGPLRVEACEIEGRVFGGHIGPLKRSQKSEGVGEHTESQGAILVLEDFTEEVELQQRLRHAENLAAVGRMSAQVAHEVRNPLHSIGLEAEMALERVLELGDIPLKQSVQSILASVDRLEKITQNYLKLSRLSTGKREVVDIGSILESVLALYTPACEAQGIQVDWRRLTNLPLQVRGDADLLEQALGNLFRNALEALASVRGPRVTWSMGLAETGRIWIRIEDNGPGVAEEIRDRLFVPFVTSRPQGTGLGLSFVRKVIEDHGGQIHWLPPTELGQGAVFEIALPALGPAYVDNSSINQGNETYAH